MMTISELINLYSDLQARVMSQVDESSSPEQDYYAGATISFLIAMSNIPLLSAVREAMTSSDLVKRLWGHRSFNNFRELWIKQLFDDKTIWN